MHLRMQQDSIVWAMFTGPLGIEGARLLANADTVQLLDKLNDQYIKKPFHYLGEILPIPVQLNQLVDMVMGNNFYLTSEETSFDIDSNSYYIEYKTPLLSIGYLISSNEYTITEMRLKDAFFQREAIFTFGDYKEVDGSMFAFHRDIQFIDGKNVINVTMDFNKVQVNEALTFPFKVSDKYEKVD